MANHQRIPFLPKRREDEPTAAPLPGDEDASLILLPRQADSDGPRDDNLPRPPSSRLLRWMGGLLFIFAVVATLLFALLVQRVSAWPDYSPLQAAIAATAPVTPLNATRPGPVVVLLVGNLRASSPLTALQSLPAARWQIDAPLQPPESYLSNLLHGAADGALKTAADHPFTTSASSALSGTLAGLGGERTIFRPASIVAPAYLQPSTAATTISQVVSDTRSGSYDLIIASLPGLAPCNLGLDCANITHQLDAGIRQVAASLGISGTLLIVGDYGAAGNADPYTDSPASSDAPLLLLSGAGIKPGRFASANLNDVAPTVAALLGTSPPATTEGQILWPALNLPPRDAAIAEYNLAAQHARLAQAYSTFGSPPSSTLNASVHANLNAAAEAVRVPDYQSALTLSTAALTAAEQQLEDSSQSASNTASWGRLPLLLLIVAALLAAAFGWWRQLGFVRPLLFYVAIALGALLLEIGLLYLLAVPTDSQFAALPADWLIPTAYVFIILGIACGCQIALGIAVTMLYRRAYYRRPPTPAYAEDDQIAIWQLRVSQPLTTPLLVQAAYSAAFTLLALFSLAASIIYWQYGFASDFPPPNHTATLLLLDMLILSAASALLAIFVTPLVAIATYRLTDRRKPHPALTGQLVKDETEALPYRRHRW